MGGGGASEYIYVKLPYIQDRIQNMSIIHVPVHKITCFRWLLDLMILMGSNPLLRPLECVGPENLDFFGFKWQIRSLLFQGPKKSGPTPSNGLQNKFICIKIIMFCPT
jgi:hypothetical protein